MKFKNIKTGAILEQTQNSLKSKWKKSDLYVEVKEETK